MIVGHVMGLPVEESVLQLVSTGAAITAIAVGGRTMLARMRNRIRGR